MAFADKGAARVAVAHGTGGGDGAQVALTQQALPVPSVVALRYRQDVYADWK